jgi:hypothetical protein
MRQEGLEDAGLFEGVGVILTVAVSAAFVCDALLPEESINLCICSP